MTFWPWLQKSTKPVPWGSIWWLSGVGSSSRQNQAQEGRCDDFWPWLQTSTKPWSCGSIWWLPSFGFSQQNQSQDGRSDDFLVLAPVVEKTSPMSLDFVLWRFHIIYIYIFFIIYTYLLLYIIYNIFYICIDNCIHFGSKKSLQDCMLSWSFHLVVPLLFCCYAIHSCWCTPMIFGLAFLSSVPISQWWQLSMKLSFLVYSVQFPFVSTTYVRRGWMPNYQCELVYASWCFSVAFGMLPVYRYQLVIWYFTSTVSFYCISAKYSIPVIFSYVVVFGFLKFLLEFSWRGLF